MKIASNVYEEVIAHAKAGLPNEACGYLAGADDTLTVFYPMTNVDASPEHFSLDVKEQFAAMKDARSRGVRLMSVYHSHPQTPARLSAEDIAELNDPETLYIIVSLAEETPDMKAYWLNKPDEATVEIKREDLIQVPAEAVESEQTN